MTRKEGRMQAKLWHHAILAGTMDRELARSVAVACDRYGLTTEAATLREWIARQEATTTTED